MQQNPTQESAPAGRPVKAGFFGLTVGRPIAMGVRDMMEQTQLMVEHLLPAISAMNSP